MCVIDPGRFRDIDELLQTETKGKAIIEVVSFKEIAEGEEKWD
jgi:ribosome maturation protein SDO1